MEYIVVSDSNLKKFINKVNEMIGEGWRPVGGICIFQGGNYYQAMVRDKP